MTHRKLVAALAIMVIIVVVFAGLITINKIIQSPSSSQDEQTHQQQPEHEPNLAPVISTYMYELSGYWTRDSSTDLPVYVAALGYDINNIGNANAEDVSVSIKIDGTTYKQHTIPQLAPYQKYTSTFTVRITYDTTKTVSLYASCSKSSDLDEYEIQARLDRQPLSADIRKLYITPDDPIVHQIFEGKPWWDIRADWEVILGWVKEEISYEYDDVLFNEKRALAVA